MDCGGGRTGGGIDLSGCLSGCNGAGMGRVKATGSWARRMLDTLRSGIEQSGAGVSSGNNGYLGQG